MRPENRKHSCEGRERTRGGWRESGVWRGHGRSPERNKRSQRTWILSLMWILAGAVSIVATPGFGQILSVPGSEQTSQPRPAYLDVPFEMYRDYLIVVQGSLGGTKKLNFILDTGADPSVIDSHTAQKLHMVGVAGKLALLNQNVEVQQAVLPSVQIGPLRADSLPVLIRDLGFLEKSLGIRIDAVIGLDVLSLSNFSIDYARKKIVFGTGQSFVSAVRFQSGPPFVTVQMEVDGVSIRLLLDTGASGLLLFQSRIHDRLPQLTVLDEKTSSNMGGDFRKKRVLLTKTNLGGMDFGQQTAFVVEDQEDTGRDFDGLLGTSALGLKQIAFDFERLTFSWNR